jgi:O-antigen ligase
MNTPFLDIIGRLNLQSFVVLTALTVCLLYFVLPRKIYGLMFFLTISGALVGSSIPIVAAASSLLRWIIIFLLFVSSFLFGKMKVSVGMLLFWGYVFLGFISLLGSNSMIWQFQKGSLLLMVAIAIPLAYGDKPYIVYKLSLIAIAIVASLFSIYSFIPLQSQLSVAERFSGFSQAAPNFAMTLGGLLPFTFWGLWRAESRWIKLLCGLGFILGTVTLIFSGQRAGTIAGIVGIIPLMLVMSKKKVLSWQLLLILVFVLLSGYFILQNSAKERIDFLTSRYRVDAGLSDRELIWDKALSAINENPFLGHGIGASETVISSSFHNTYLEVWFNTGLLGLFFFIAAQSYFFYRIFFLGRHYNDLEVKSILALTLGYMLGFVVLCTVESVGAAASTLSVILYIFLGVIISNNTLFKNSFSKSDTQENHRTKDQSDFVHSWVV